MTLATNGANIVILADEYFQGTTAVANQVLAPFGMQMKRIRDDGGTIGARAKRQHILEWQARYDQNPFECGANEIETHQLTRGVTRLHWWRPCPVICTGSANVLVRNPANHDEYFAAVAGSEPYIVAVGTSLWSNFADVGWPFNNARFFANLLVGGDAEQAMRT
jgi:hypothetical protein